MTPLTDDIYWASQPPAIQALRAMPEDGTRVAAAMALAAQGYTIDVPIMAWNWDAVQVMTLRAQYGYTWVPSALSSPVAMAPGLTTPGFSVYDPAHPPANGIIVSLDAASYPPYQAAPTVHPSAPASLVGFAEGAGYWSALPAATSQLANGQSYTDPLGRGVFVFSDISTPFGNTVYFKQ